MALDLKLTPWTWIIFGAIITVMSGYIYWFVPKNGDHNGAMAFFFFIGILFMIIGAVQIFFKTKKDEKSMFDSMAAPKTPAEAKANAPMVIDRLNKVDEAVGQLARQQQEQANVKQTVSHQMNQQASGHSNTYYQMHQYKGPVHESSQSVHAQHPVSQYAQQAQSQSTPQHHPVQNSEHGIRCRRCGNVNAGHANYCHSCGNRLV